MSERPKKKPATKKKTGSRNSSPRTPKSRRSSGGSQSPKSTSSARRKEAPPKATTPATSTPLPPSIPSYKTLCPTHNKEFKMFCESREEPVCEDCLLSAPYTGIPQKIVPIEEAYRYRLAAVYNTLNSHLFSKREQLLAQIHRVEFRLDEVKRVKLLIERDMKSEFSAMNERLNSVCGTKVAILQHDISELQGDLDRITNIINSVETSSHDMVGFLQKSTELRDLLELSLAKPYRTEITVGTEDLPRELANIREMAMNYPALTSLVALKDEIIWRIMHEKPGTGDVDSSAQKELAEWAKLTDKFAQELSKFQMTCEYCEVQLDDESVNSNCPKNTGYTILQDTSAPSQFQGNGRHYFSKRPTRPATPSTLHRNKEASAKTPPEREQDSMVKRIREILKERRINLDQAFKENDILNSGVISPTNFYDILSNRLSLSLEEIQYLLNKYDPQKTGRVQYPLLIRDIVTEGSFV